ncbi:Gti1/Pac2 family-domain-containing protein [Crassisporium funariophilum]|nr:Gti1/Pac2 family-domain-containing protein [Crassisporium funariophilum]
MQRATITGIRIRSPADARTVFHSVFMNILPMVTRRLDTEERSLITTGSVYVWEERGPHAELTGVGIERWTDGIRWGPSRVREGFLFYQEKPTSQQLYSERLSPYDSSRSVLIKQTYTVFVDTPRGQRKWHLIAYFTEETANRLRTIDDIPQLVSLSVPHAKYKSARSAKGRPDHIFNPESEGPVFTSLEYVPYTPRKSPTVSTPPSSHEPNTWSDRSSSQPQDEPIPQRPGPMSTTSSDDSRENLVPLMYLQERPPPRRHPTDEKILMLLTTKSFDDKQNRLSGTRSRFES